MGMKFNRLVQAIAAGGVPVPRIVGFAATGARMPFGTINPAQSGGTRYIVKSRGAIEITADCEYLELHFDNVYYQSSGRTTHAFPREITHFALERLNATLTVPVTFGGNPGVIMATDGHATSDKLYASAFGLSKFTKGERYWMRDREKAVPGGVFIPGGYSAKVATSVVASGTFAEYYDLATESAIDVYGTGPMTTQTGRFTIGTAAPGPQAIVGKFINSGEISMLVTGDSVDWGTGDKTSLVTTIAGSGHVDRSMVNGSGTAVIPFLNWAVPGSSTPDITDATIRQYYQYANVLYLGHALNDIGLTSDGADMPTIYSNMLAQHAYARSVGIKRILRRGVPPVTTSAGGQWVSAVDQTVKNDFLPGSYGDQYEAQLAAWKTSGEIHDWVGVRSPVADATEAYKWLTTGANKYATIDGFHPSDVGHGLMSATGLLRAMVLAQQPYV